MSTKGSGDLEVNIIDGDESLVMDLYFPNVIRGNDADEISSSELLEKMKEIGGEHSGIDADMVDGYHASDFVMKNIFPKDRVVAGNYLGEPGDGGSYEEFVEAFNENFKIG